VVCYLELAQGSTVGGASTSSNGDTNSQIGRESSVASDSVALPPPGLERGPGVGETRPPSFRGGANNREQLGIETESTLSSHPAPSEDFFDDTESSITSVSQAAAERRQMEIRMRNGVFGNIIISFNALIFLTTLI
jgi:hypothetical protein